MSTNDKDWMDEWGACKVCGGEIPHGHSDTCCIHAMQMQLAQLTKEREDLQRDLSESNHWRDRHSRDAEAYSKQSQANWEKIQQLTKERETDRMLILGLEGNLKACEKERDEAQRCCASARSIISQFISELDQDHTNHVRCTVGDLGVDLEDAMRQFLSSSCGSNHIDVRELDGAIELLKQIKDESLTHSLRAGKELARLESLPKPGETMPQDWRADL